MSYTSQMTFDSAKNDKMLEDSSNSVIKRIRVSGTKPDNKHTLYKTMHNILQKK